MPRVSASERRALRGRARRRRASSRGADVPQREQRHAPGLALEPSGAPSPLLTRRDERPCAAASDSVAVVAARATAGSTTRPRSPAAPGSRRLRCSVEQRDDVVDVVGEAGDDATGRPRSSTRGSCWASWSRRAAKTARDEGLRRWPAGTPVRASKAFSWLSSLLARPPKLRFSLRRGLIAPCADRLTSRAKSSTTQRHRQRDWSSSSVCRRRCARVRATS